MKVYFFTGAGVSAESGMRTFRDSNGLWENNKISEICNINTWRLHKPEVFSFYSNLRMKLEKLKPNKIHLKIAELQNLYGVDNVIIITQNIDDLFERAGCKNVLHLHGDLKTMICTNKKCKHLYNVGYNNVEAGTLCPVCNENMLKPNVVFFGESAPQYHFMKRYFREIKPEDIFITIGTLGNVIPINRHLDFIEADIKILNNLEDSNFIDSSKYDYTFFELGSVAIDKITKIISNHFTNDKDSYR